MAILYVVATPIGNLQDLSPRGAETLRNADLIIAEDTRVTMKLCQVFGLKAPLVSCHRHSEDSKAPGLARKILEEDLAAALVTDAGTPCISDPGSEVVKACVPFAGRIPAFLFHGFSRSAGLLPQIYGMNGFVSIGPALLNDHAVNYRAMAKSIPLERLLIETDMDESAAPQDGAPSRVETLNLVHLKLAEIRGVDAVDLERALDASARRFTEALA